LFTYIDPTVRQRLIGQGSLARIAGDGTVLDPAEPVPEGTKAISILGPIPLPIRRGTLELEAKWYAAVRHTELSKVEALAGQLREAGSEQLFAGLATSMAVNSMLVVGDPQTADNPLVRVHSSCLTGDVFGSMRCECGPQLLHALTRIHEDPQGGILVYMAGHEGRGIGLWAKAATYLLQDAGESTYEANRSLGLPEDSRDFSDAASLLLWYLGDVPFRLLTNNPKKIVDLAGHGLSKISAVKHVSGVGEWNRRYLSAKRDWGHKISSEDLDDPS
jgi:GTP cyclohydrolase II